MRRVKKTTGYDLEALLLEYSARPVKYSGKEIEQRREEFETAYGMNRLEGAGQISVIETKIADLWITGRITEKEYYQLCDFDVERTNTRHLGYPQIKG